VFCKSSMLLYFLKIFSINFSFNDETIFYIDVLSPQLIRFIKKPSLIIIRSKISDQNFKEIREHGRTACT
jgi:hypothetical protein